jgi:small subunit ribosomal protein S3
MGQKTNPIANRLGFIRFWDSNWYEKKNYKDNIFEDYQIRRYIYNKLYNLNISKIYIERNIIKNIFITITTSRPGILIGKYGKEVDKLKKEIKNILYKDVKINILEISYYALDPILVAKDIAHYIYNRAPYKRIIKSVILDAISRGAKGIKIKLSGRLNGAEMARTEYFQEGRIPLSTFRADIDYAFTEAYTTYGMIGIKVWIMKSEYSKKIQYYILE